MIFNKIAHFFKIVGLHRLFFVYNICWTDRYLKRNLGFDFRKDAVLKQQDFNQKIEELVGIGQSRDGQLTTDEIKEFFAEDSLTAKQETTLFSKIQAKGVAVVLSEDEADSDGTDAEDEAMYNEDGERMVEIKVDLVTDVVEPTDEDIASVAADEEELLDSTDENFDNDEEETVQ